MSSAVAAIKEEKIDSSLLFLQDAVSQLMKDALQTEQRYITALQDKLNNAFDTNLFRKVSTALTANQADIALLFNKLLTQSCSGKTRAENITTEHALNFYSDELSLISESELNHQLMLEHAFNTAHESFESMSLSSGFKYLPASIALPGAGVLKSTSPGALAWMLQHTLESIISNKVIVRVIYRFAGARFFSGLPSVYVRSTAPLTALVAQHKPVTPTASFNANPTGMQVSDVDNVHEINEAIKAFASRPDIVELLSKKDIPAQFGEEHVDSLTDISFENLRPDTIIKTATVDDVMTILRQYSQDDRGEDLRSTLKTALTDLSADNMVTIIDRMSENVLNLVSHLFRELTDTEDFIPAVKKQLNRLQSPVTQVALVNAELFQSEEHPIRYYLNTVGRLASQITNEEEEGYRRLRNNINYFTKAFCGDIDLFSSAANTLIDFVENTEYAVKWKNDELAPDDFHNNLRFIPVRDYLESMSSLLSRELSFHKIMKFVWSSILTRALHRHGEDSEQWKSLTEVYSNALWSTQASANDGGKRLVLRSLPNIVNGVRDVCKEYKVKDNVRELLLNHMFDIHMQIIRGTDGALIEESQESVRALFESLKGTILEDDGCEYYREQDALLPGIENVPLNPLQNVYERFDAISSFGSVNSVDENEPCANDAGMDAHFRRLEQLPLASVFEFSVEGEAHRFVLKEKSIPLGRYTFCSSDGKVTITYTKAELVLKIMRGEARRLDDDVWFERGLNQVFKKLNLGS
jgi:hypothetical protein